jgi:hypothetical protein
VAEADLGSGLDAPTSRSQTCWKSFTTSLLSFTRFHAPGYTFVPHFSQL